MKALVLAAGVGSRLDPLTSQIPKPMVPIANVPVMEHIISLLKRHGITEIAANLHHLPDSLIKHFGDGSKFGVKLHLKYEPELTGDAGGARTLKPFLGDDTFIVLMGDLLTDTNLSEIIRQHKAKKALATIAMKRVEDVSLLGVGLVDSNNFITGFQEKPKPEEALSDLASVGIYVLEPEIFDYIPPQGVYGFGRQLFPDLVARKLPVLCAEIKDYWSDVGTIKQYRLSNFDAIDGKLKLDLPGIKTDFGWIGENSFIDDSATIDGVVMVGKNTRIKSGVKLRGHVIIGDNCTVGENATLEDSVIWSDTNIEAGAKLVSCVIGHNCLVKNGAVHQEAATVA